jgi:hypothetical protein
MKEKLVRSRLALGVTNVTKRAKRLTIMPSFLNLNFIHYFMDSSVSKGKTGTGSPFLISECYSNHFKRGWGALTYSNI